MRNEDSAKSSTVPGIKLSEDLKFKELGYINNEQLGFILDVYDDTKKKPIIEKYRKKYLEALAEWKTQQDGSKRNSRQLKQEKDQTQLTKT